MNRLAFALIALLLTAAPALAHRDYERPVGWFNDDRGNLYSVVRHFTDGIIMIDPVKLQVRSLDGAPSFETPYFRDVVVVQSSDDIWNVFGTDLFGLSFWEGWVLKDGRLEPMESPWRVFHALWTNLCCHWLGYGFTALLPWLRRRHNKSRQAWIAALVVSGLMWLMATYVYGRLAPLVTFAVCATSIAVRLRCSPKDLNPPPLPQPVAT